MENKVLKIEETRSPVKLEEIRSRYERWFIENSEVVNLFERVMWAVTFLIPNRYDENEFNSTLLNSILECVGSYHDFVWIKYSDLVKKRKNISVSPEVQSQLEKVCYFPTSHMNIASILTTIQHIELLCEIISQIIKVKFPYGPIKKSRWITIWTIELIKAYLRCKLLYESSGAILVNRTIPSRNNNTTDEENIDNNQPSSQDGRKLRPNLLNEIRESEIRKEAIRVKDITHPTEVDLYIVLGEILWVTRPIIYLYLLQKNGKKSWWPWMISLLMDLSSWYCTHTRKLNRAENKEILHRQLQWLLYLIRSPCFDVISKSVSGESSFLKNARSIQPVRAVLELAIGILNLTRKRYFYTAGSN